MKINNVKYDIDIVNFNPAGWSGGQSPRGKGKADGSATKRERGPRRVYIERLADIIAREVFQQRRGD
jgi:hypothetical protein